MSNPSSKKLCIYCGNNPTNHTMSFISNAIGAVAAPFHEKVMTSEFGSFVVGLGEKALPFLSAIWFPFGIAKWSDDKQKLKIARGKVLWEEAERRGITMQNLEVFGRATDIYRAKIAGKWMQFQGLPRPGGESQNPALLWVDDKAILKKKLSAAGIPTPRGASFSSPKYALEFFKTLSRPVITKPRFGSRGRHTTTFIQTEEEFKKGFRVARMLCPYVIIEEHLVGAVYRGTVVGGKTAGILAGEPPRVTGDGVNSVAELVRRKDEKKEKGVSAAVLNDAYLERQGYDRNTILLTGKTIDLTEKIGVSYGGRSVELTGEAHPKFSEYLEKAAKIIDDSILGFDFIAEDVTKDPDSQKWGIIECNGAPFINLHHDPLVGKPQNVAGKVWDLFGKK